VRNHALGVARILTGSPRTILAVLLAALVVAAALVTGMLRATPTAAEESGAAPTGSVEELPSGRPAELGEPRDPLSIEEIGYAEHLAAAALPAGSADVTGAAGAELLSVDLASMDPDTTERPVAVSYYDYASDAVVEVTVDLYAGEVSGTTSADGLQPAPTPAETYEATRLLVHSDKAKRVATEYTAMTGDPISADDLIVTGGSYYDSDLTRADDACGAHRCVELQLQEPTGKYLSSADYVVDLSTGEVIVLARRDATSTLLGGRNS
jgi:hypothetical protein